MSISSSGSLLFHGSMLVLILTAVWAAHRNWRQRAWLLAVTTIGSSAALLAYSLGDHGFGSLRLLAYGLFGYLAVLLAAAVISLGRRKRYAAIVFAASFALLEAIAIDAFLIEPHWLQIRQVQIVTSKIHKPVTICKHFGLCWFFRVIQLSSLQGTLLAGLQFLHHSSSPARLPSAPSSSAP